MAPLEQFMDHRTAPLNPCSIETIPEPIRLTDGRSVWPMMMSCYQLHTESTQRVGHMDLSLIEVPDIAQRSSAMPLRFDPTPHIVLMAESSTGILDGKWSSMPNRNEITADPSTGTNGTSWCFASAHSSGEIRIHSLTFATAQESTGIHSTIQSTDMLKHKFLGQSERIKTHPSVSSGEDPPLCLSLSWDDPAAYRPKPVGSSGLSRIVSTYSNGTMAIHDVAFGFDNQTVQLIARDTWMAHKMFTSPTEVWSACFMSPNVVLSGGDEGQLKVWDIRSTTRPMQVLDESFAAGVTCVSPHPTDEHIVAVGSYDECVCLFDVRLLSQRRPLCKSGSLGGGIWRIKWHPYSPNRMLVAAMHAGCRVLNFTGGNCFSSATNAPSDASIDDNVADNMLETCTKSFTEHESMAYGSDWLVCPHPTKNGYYEAAASCSFYDRAVFLWDSVP